MFCHARFNSIQLFQADSNVRACFQFLVDMHPGILIIWMHAYHTKYLVRCFRRLYRNKVQLYTCLRLGFPYDTLDFVVPKLGLCVDKGMGIFNGDTGIIEEINDFAETMTISFDEGRKVEYPFKLLEELELAYAVTIHKSQGSEYPAVVIPLLSGPRMLMNRNLLYTAVTRAKKCVTIVGDDTTFEQMIENNSQQRRYSGLKDRLLENTI